ncbi:MAG: M18 family aminopeptidase [Clostridia bacterium]|nr:M18 family aminopeptidase [Clostridia bacterium]
MAKNTVKNLCSFLENSYSCYQATANVIEFLKDEGFVELNEREDWSLQSGKGYFVCKDGSALIAFKIGGEHYAYNIIASHSDSPCLKLKYNPEIKSENVEKLNIEVYGGLLLYSFLDRKLAIAGRKVMCNKESGEIKSALYKYKGSVVVPSLAIHMNRDANKGFTLNPQTNMLPLFADGEKKFADELNKCENGFAVSDYDLFVCCDDKPFVSGDCFTAPRIDNLSSVYCGVTALAEAQPKAIAMAVSFDNEEVGSRTKQGAGGRFLRDTLQRINVALGKSETDFQKALADSFFVSADNAHAAHPNYPDKSDLTNKVLMNKGVVIKHHANQNYTTDAVSAAVIKSIYDKVGVMHQDFFMRSDLPCGGTLGAIGSSQLSIRSVDIGLAQLAMHSSMETAGIHDVDEMIKGDKAFFECVITSNAFDSLTVK